MKQGIGELVGLIATMMALAALSIDAVLPALPAIADTFELAPDGSAIQQVITALILGMTIGQLAYGPLSDRFGRRPAMLAGVGLLLVGSVATVSAAAFSVLLAGRFLQGVGVAALRIVPMAIVRDRYEGAAMARIISLAMAVFVLVPCVAPLLGQGVLVLAGWRAVFVMLAALTVLVGTWFWLRQPETLNPSDRASGGFRELLGGLGSIVRNQETLAYTLAMGLLQGAHVGYILSAEPIFHRVYPTGGLFPVYFALGAISIGIAGVVNAQIVERLGVRRVCSLAPLGAIVASGVVLLLPMPEIPLVGFLVGLSLVFFFFGLTLGNMNAIALQPHGDVAGLANSAISFISGSVSVAAGTLIGAAFDNSVRPLMWGVLLATTASVVLTLLPRKVERNPEESRGDSDPSQH